MMAMDARCGDFVCCAEGAQPLDLVAACLHREARERARALGMSDPDGYARWVTRRNGLDGWLVAANAAIAVTGATTQVMPHAKERQ